MKKKRWKTFLILAIVVPVLILGVIALGAWRMFGTFVVAARSIYQLQDGLYVMEYRGDYGFDEFLARGGAADDSAVADYLTGFLSRGYYKKADNEIKPGDYGCSTVCVKDKDGAVYFGRNFDWAKGRAMIVHTVPENGYESLSTCDLDFLGFGDDYQPDGSMPERIQTLAAIYVPLDGMNEKGLVVADLMAGDDEETHQKTDKPDLTTTTAIRLLLDRAANVDEAVELLKQYDMNSSIGAAHHFSLADATGKSVVVEYVNGEMLVTETPIVTNHYLADCAKKGVGSEQSHLRFDRLSEIIPHFHDEKGYWSIVKTDEAHTSDLLFLEDGDPRLDIVDDMISRTHYVEHSDPERLVNFMLLSVWQSNYPQTDGSYETTLWSIVYNPEDHWADFYFKEDEGAYTLFLNDEDEFVSPMWSESADGQEEDKPFWRIFQ
jgi:hypothetical protein